MDVFVYGTLTDPARVDALLTDFSFRGDATLVGLRRVEGQYPTLVPGDTTEGRIVRTPEVDRLDRYEGVDRGLYRRVEVPLADGSGTVAVYVGDPDALGATEGTWPGEGPFRDRVERYLREAAVSVRPAG